MCLFVHHIVILSFLLQFLDLTNPLELWGGLKTPLLEKFKS